MADLRKVTDGFFVAPQLSGEDFAQLAGMGIRHVLNNRPDGEELGQLSSAEAEAAATAAGVTYQHAPFQGPPTPQALADLRALLAGSEGAVLAYCRTGTRSITAWAMMQATEGTMSADEIVGAAKVAGYELGAMKDLLRQLANG